MPTSRCAAPRRSGSGQSVTFSPDIGQAARERTTLLRDLRQAFERRELSIVYQPQIDLTTGQMIGAEALLRWQTRPAASSSRPTVSSPLPNNPA